MIPYGRQSINEDDFESVKFALQNEFLTTGPLVDQFETDLARVVGAPTISVTSGTAALHCAYAAIELKSGDEVITPDNFCGYAGDSSFAWRKNSLCGCRI